MRKEKDFDGDEVWVIENEKEAREIMKKEDILLCVCGICGEYYWNDNGILSHMKEHKKGMKTKKIRYGIPQTTDGRIIRWFVDK